MTIDTTKHEPEETSTPEPETPESELETEPKDGPVLETDRPAEPEPEVEPIEVKAEIIPVTEPEPVEVKAEMISPVEELLPPINIHELNIMSDFNAFPD